MRKYNNGKEIMLNIRLQTCSRMGNYLKLSLFFIVKCLLCLPFQILLLADIWNGWKALCCYNRESCLKGVLLHMGYSSKNWPIVKSLNSNLCVIRIILHWDFMSCPTFLDVGSLPFLSNKKNLWLGIQVSFKALRNYNRFRLTKK